MRNLVDAPPAHWPAWRVTLHDVIFGHESRAGKYFDVALIISIIASVIAVMLDSVASIRAGYGDIAPETALGQALASMIMLLGYAIVAVPTGIVTVELTRNRDRDRLRCGGCGAAGHDADARHCKRCGTRLAGATAPPTEPPAGPIDA